MNHEFQFVCIKLTEASWNLNLFWRDITIQVHAGPLDCQALGVFKAGPQKGARHFPGQAAAAWPPLRPNRTELADHRRIRKGFKPSPRPVALRAPALREGRRVPRNPSSADNRRQRSIKCAAKFWGHLWTPIGSQFWMLTGNCGVSTGSSFGRSRRPSAAAGTRPFALRNVLCVHRGCVGSS